MSPTSCHCSTPRWRGAGGGAGAGAGGNDLLSHHTGRQYRRRWGVARPCSGWERVGPPRTRHRLLPRSRGPAAPDQTTEQVERAIGRGTRTSGGGNAAPSGLSTAALQPSRAFDARPIHQVISLGPYLLRVGDLILGRASHLDAVSAYRHRTTATQPCSWQNNWYTGGPSAPVLSY